MLPQQIVQHSAAGGQEGLRIAAVVAAQPRLQKQAGTNNISKHFNFLPERQQVSVAVCCASPNSELGRSSAWKWQVCDPQPELSAIPSPGWIPHSLSSPRSPTLVPACRVPG